MSTALITGASSGLGLEFARLFARDGHSLILVARRKELLEKASTDLLAAAPEIKIHIIAMDLSLAHAGQALYNKIIQLGESVDFLINNAAFGSNGTFHSLPLDRELQMIDLNIHVLVELTGLLLPQMVARGSGRILNVGSTAGFQCGPFMATYFATKAFVNSWSEALNEELRGTGVTCTVLAPGATQTEFAKVANLYKSKLFTTGKLADAQSVAAFGYKAMLAGRGLAIAGFKNNSMVQLLRVTPRYLARKVTSYLTKP